MNDKKTNSTEVYNQAEAFLIDEVARFMDFLGAKTLLGRIYGQLLVSPGPVSLRELSEKLHVSKPAISTTVNFGLAAEIFKKIYVPESPRESFYELGYGFLEMFIDPEIKKIRLLKETFSKAINQIESSKVNIDDDMMLHDLYYKIKYLEEGYDIILQDFIVFGESTKLKIKNLREKYNH